MTEALVKQVKRKLNITWYDEDTEARVMDIIESAIPDMIKILGITDPDFDFSVRGTENTLFLAYCFYEFNHALDEFDANYHNKIAQTREKHAVSQFEAESGESTSD